MPMQLENSIFELRRELELVNNRLAIAKEGLKVIRENGDVLNIAKLTLEEIDTI